MSTKRHCKFTTSGYLRIVRVAKHACPGFFLKSPAISTHSFFQFSFQCPVQTSPNFFLLPTIKLLFCVIALLRFGDSTGLKY
ncbi:hypothetical protein TSAR_014014 [Trichomalopsis sarcophagae]|uniref:Uncharacterized protein n=1 Tax=Trichomalopsis sarcophagae TaxID=543379 RepID=A0A232F071_9HYME|nr:hypothetical protein TSAR_014013 [Trichomalopsis sarcophagae]OXU24012.1 hypothetical protein TSAR_014014 [Trichomalopsis sarcophagae]